MMGGSFKEMRKKLSQSCRGGQRHDPNRFRSRGDLARDHGEESTPRGVGAPANVVLKDPLRRRHGWGSLLPGRQPVGFD